MANNSPGLSKTYLKFPGNQWRLAGPAIRYSLMSIAIISFQCKLGDSKTILSNCSAVLSTVCKRAVHDMRMLSQMPRAKHLLQPRQCRCGPKMPQAANTMSGLSNRRKSPAAQFCPTHSTVTGSFMAPSTSRGPYAVLISLCRIM